ncbi:MAG: hypothetical protein WD605_00740 [Candidatus Paceibacterota bacterium]
MEERVRAVTWEAPEYHHIERGNDWYWALGIVAGCAAIASFFFGNFLFAILILVAAATITLQTRRHPQDIPFMVGSRGVRVGERLFTYSNLESYRIDEENESHPQLLLKSKQFYMPLIVIPIPEERVHDIEELVRDRLPEEDLEESVAHKLLDLIGF